MSQLVAQDLLDQLKELMVQLMARELLDQVKGIVQAMNAHGAEKTQVVKLEQDVHDLMWGLLMPSLSEIGTRLSAHDNFSPRWVRLVCSCPACSQP